MKSGNIQFLRELWGFQTLHGSFHLTAIKQVS